MKFSGYWQVLKHLITNEMIIKLYLCQVLEVPISFSLFTIQYANVGGKLLAMM